MIRFRNPSSSLETMLASFDELYLELKDKPYFDNDDIALVLAKANLMASSGFTGDVALAKGANKDRSRDSHLIEDVHSYIISQSLELFLDELTDSTYQKKDKSNIETVNPTGCNSYMTYSYYLLLDKDAFVKELNYVTEKNNCAMKLVTRGNPPTRSLTIYPKSLAVTSADFIEQLTNFIVSKDPKYQEEKSKLIKRIDKLDRKLIKNAKNPTGFWETVVGAFVDLFS